MLFVVVFATSVVIVIIVLLVAANVTEAIESSYPYACKVLLNY